MDAELHEMVLHRLKADHFLSITAQHLVAMACEGEEYLASALGGPAGPQAPGTKSTAEPPPAHAYLNSVTVEGFRGIGPATTLTLRPGPGLTLVIGRNGSGKSSFAEALEILLTGDNRRWKDRHAAWKEDWRNLHQAHTRVEGRFLVEGDKAPATIVRSWADAEKDVTASTVEVQRTGRQKGALEALGWAAITQTYRPFLSYNELGSMLDDGPSKLYDALSTVLGLEELVAAQDLLRKARLARTTTLKDATQRLKGLRSLLSGSDDPRAQACLVALEGRSWDLDAAERQVVAGGDPTGGDNDLARLQRLADCPGPSASAVAEAAGALVSAAQAAASMAGTESSRALERAGLLEQAVAFHRQHGDTDCPVCGTTAVLGGGWAERSLEEIKTLRAEARSAEEARRRLTQARQAALALVGPVPQPLKSAAGLGLDREVGAALALWETCASSAAIEDPNELSQALVQRSGPLEESLKSLRVAAAAEVARREDRWRPVATAVAEWLGLARQAQAGGEAVPAITDAENWVKEASAAIRDERFAPIADKATGIWDVLRGQSNVALQRISLGAWPQRRVTLDVTVDGVSGAALGVMSQGELHALALSLFLPRATLPASPFGFIVIDDPVQSMDPARVEGLAKVLDRAAGGRQVIVFTHDDRLPEACRRLQIEAQMIEVGRRSGSVIELTRVTGPVDRYLGEARAIASTDELTEAVITRVAGAFCRLALEAACTEAVMRRRLGRGERHQAVEALVTGAETLAEKTSLALFDEEGRTPGEILNKLGRYGQWAADTYKDANKGAHQALTVPALRNLIENTGRLARQLATAP
jgi:energy-coupling factor transporter ATP-binding protein EcfA2